MDQEKVAALCVRMLQNANHLIQNDTFERISGMFFFVCLFRIISVCLFFCFLFLSWRR